MPLPESVATSLNEHRGRQSFEQKVSGTGWANVGELVFITSDGRPLDARDIVTQFKRHLTAAGLPDMRWHDMRHTCASLMLAKGVDFRTIMETMGHSQIRTTMNTYSHVIPELQRRAAGLVDDLFGN